MSVSVVIVIPMLPGPELSPNARVHWRKRAKAAAAFRECAGWATRAALNDFASGASFYCGYDYPDSGGVVMDFVVSWSGRRKMMDDGNCKAAMKALVDGVADVLWLGEDAHVRIGELRQTRGDGTVTVVLRGAS